MNAIEEKELSAVESAEQAMREAAAAGGTAGETEPEKESVDGEKTERLICFVCTGNTCRSPMAAAMFNFLFPERNAFAVSAGLCADGSPISENAKEALRRRGVPCTVENNYTDHVSRTVTPEMIATASQVIGISSRHAMALICAFPGQAEKISAMPEDIADPFGGTVDDYVRCLADIEKSLRAMFGEK